MSDGFILLGGYLNLIAGILLLVYWYAFALFLPYRTMTTTLSILVNNRNWVWINAVGVAGALAGLLAQAALLAVQGESVVWYSSAGFYVAVTGTTLLIGTMLWETVLWPILHRVNESLLDFQGPVYSNRVFLGFFITAGLVFGLGYVLVGVGISVSGVLPRFPGILLALGAPAFALGTLFGKLQVYIRSIGITLMSAGLVWLALVMI